MFASGCREWCYVVGSGRLLLIWWLLDE